jgi:DNA replication protein DnaC
MTSPQKLEMPSLQNSTVDRECPKHGTYAARVIDLSLVEPGRVLYGRCPTCATIEANEHEAATLRAQTAEREQKIRRLLGRSGIPPRFEDRTFANYAASNLGQRVALASCRAYGDNWPAKLEVGGSLVLTGGPGTGKTHLACAIASAVCREHLAGAWFGSVTQLLRHIKDTYRRDSERSEQDAINDLVEPDLLIVDEIGVQTGSDHEKMLLFEVLNERYQRLRPTILISNLNGADLEGYIGQRVMDRFRECGDIIAFDWQSHRGKRAA